MSFIVMTFLGYKFADCNLFMLGFRLKISRK